MQKREFLKLSGIIGAGLIISPITACKTIQATNKGQKLGFNDPFLTEKGAFNLPALPYQTKDLEPHIDTMTMEIHHGKHHAAYIKKLNEVVKGSAFENQTLGEIFANVTTDKAQAAIRNNGGGHFNHSLFWQSLAAAANQKPQGKLAAAIQKDFTSFEKMTELWLEAGAKQFGSGWTWLCLNAENKLFICATPNQDNPLMKNIVEKEKQGTPLIGIDVWEHAYYLKYQNDRKKYLSAILNVLNWESIGKRYEAMIS
ncbi:MAG: superoxide dismutase [Bacteroidia bacterium]